MLKRMYDSMMRAAAHRYAVWFLGFFAFIESSVFPIAPDVMLVPMTIAAPKKAMLYAAVASIGSTLGGAAGYGIGYFLFAQFGQPLLHFYGYEAAFQSFAANFNAHGGWIVFAGGFTPLPYKVMTIASGVTHLHFGVFMLASIASRAARFYAEAYLVARFGPHVARFIEKYGALVSIGLFLLLISGFALVKYMF